MLGITVGRLISGPLCDPTIKSTVSHVPVIFVTCIVVAFVAFAKTVAVAFELFCVRISPCTTEVGLSTTKV